LAARLLKRQPLVPISVMSHAEALVRGAPEKRFESEAHRLRVGPDATRRASASNFSSRHAGEP
jgi:hypothetical protein